MLGVSLFISSCNLYSNHNHIGCPECGRCTDAECDGEELDKCIGHTQKHEHIACQDCGKCISELCDGLKEERCQGCIKICLTNKIYVSHLDLDIDSPKYYITIFVSISNIYIVIWISSIVS